MTERLNDLWYAVGIGMCVLFAFQMQEWFRS
jgi:hypothetical protein